MSVILKPPWTTQPQVAVGIDWSAPIARGLTALVNANPAQGILGELVIGQRAWQVAGSVLAARSGQGIGQTTPGTNGVSWDRQSNTATRGPDSFFPTSPIISYGAYYTPLALDSSTCATFGVGFGSGSGYHLTPAFSDGTVRTTFYDTTPRSIDSASGAVVIGVPTFLLTTCDGATLTLYVNGRSVGTVAVGGTSITYNSFAQLDLGGAASPFGNVGSSAVYHYGAIWNRCLLPAEVAKLSVNPWQLFAPLPRRIWAPAAVASDTLMGQACL